MKTKSKIHLTVLSFALVSAFAAQVHAAGPAAAPLSEEMRALLKSLPSGDPSAASLELSMADTLFHEATDIENRLGATDENRANARAERLESLAIYRRFTAANATDARFSKVQFQIARLLTLLDLREEAIIVWKKVLEKSPEWQFRNEAAVQLGELTELSGGASSSAVETAETYYAQAIKICNASGADESAKLAGRCYYAHYRRAWALHNLNQHVGAIGEMKLSLRDGGGKAREEVLRDLILFWSIKPAETAAEVDLAIADVRKTAQESGKPALLEDLAEAYFSAGNKTGGTRVLEIYSQESFKLKHEIRLLEELYGQRRWDDFRGRLAHLGEVLPKDEPSQEDEKILRRLVVQLDGQRISEPQYAEDFKRSALLYLTVFPHTEHRTKMIDGWIASETVATAKIVKLKTWIAEAAGTPEEARLRKIRASIAQKSGDQQVVAEEMGLLALSEKDTAKKREYRYLQAHALYEAKALNEALVGFRELATPSVKADHWAVQSQHLALDVLNQQKRYPELIAQAATWTQAPGLEEKFGKDLAEMQTVSDQARFQKAIQDGQSKESLATYLVFCGEQKFMPKSCENAKVLASQLKDQNGLIAALKGLGQDEELLAETEASGRFAEAVLLTKKLKPAPTIRESIKLSILQELAGDTAGRDRSLHVLVATAAKAKSLTDSDQELLLYSLRDAAMLNESALALPFSQPNRLRIANELETGGKSSSKIRSLLLSSNEYSGEGWSKLVMASLEEKSTEQKKIGFYGKRSQADFARRLKRLEVLQKSADAYLSGADAATRVKISRLMETSYSGLATEIGATPLPAGLSEDALAQIRGSLDEMAAPFRTKAEAYQKIAVEHETKIAAAKAATSPQLNSAVTPVSFDQTRQKLALEDLHKDPSNRIALDGLFHVYNDAGNSRLAAYFEGRLKQLGPAAPVQGEQK